MQVGRAADMPRAGGEPAAGLPAALRRVFAGRLPALWLFAAALAVRLLFNVAVIGLDVPTQDTFSDWKEYDSVGRSLAAGTGFTIHGMPYLIHPPGYPLFLGALYLLFGHSYAAVKIVQSVLGALTCVLIFLIGERMFSARAGLAAAALATVYPHLVYYTGILMSETLFVFLSTAFLHALAVLRDELTPRRAALAGAVLGLACLTRPMLLFMPILLCMWIWRESGSLRRALAVTAAIGACAGFVILPWTVRNYVVTGAVVPIVATHWVTLYGANNPAILNNPEAVGGWVDPEPMSPEGYRAAYAAFLRDMLLHHPLDLAALELHKLKRFWSLFPKTQTPGRDAVINLLSYGWLLPLFLAGMALAARLPRKPWILYLWVVYFCLLTLVMHGTTRYRLPVEPVILLFAAFTLERLWERTGFGRPASSPSPGGAAS
jgi:4-amino-4-deoxy-L-arabinose transferase-like glycosyltransferase